MYKTRIAKKDLTTLEKKVYNRGHIDREHLLEFLTLLPTSDGQQIVEEVKSWLEKLHNDSKFDKVTFPQGDIDAIIGDLDSYGRVQPETILSFKERSNRTLPIK